MSRDGGQPIPASPEVSHPNENFTGIVDHRQLQGVARSVSAATAQAGLAQAAKRTLDLSVSLTALMLLLPLLLMIALLVWLGDGGSPIFRHERVGRNGRTFGCLKFRSMIVDSEAALKRHLAADPAARAEWAAARKLAKDPRITLIGHVLRKSSLDELPQLWNVLMGDMSLVGPRPIVQAEVAHYGPSFAACFSVMPGMTGLWQVSGRSIASYPQRVALDLRYATGWCLALDLAILARTVPAVLAQRGSL